jgi:hypothetical protein
MDPLTTEGALDSSSANTSTVRTPRRGLILSTSAPGKMPRSRGDMANKFCAMLANANKRRHGKLGNFFDKQSGWERDGNVSFCSKALVLEDIVVRFHQLYQ